MSHPSNANRNIHVIVDSFDREIVFSETFGAVTKNFWHLYEKNRDGEMQHHTKILFFVNNNVALSAANVYLSVFMQKICDVAYAGTVRTRLQSQTSVFILVN